MKHFFTACFALLFSAAAASGYTNIVDGGVSQTITNTFDSSTTNIWVGDLTSGNSMDVVNGGSVTNILTYVGNVSTSMNNSVSITGTNAAWISSGSMVVGNEGSSNSLSITGGGKLKTFSGFVGLSSNAANNTVLVSGAGSVWDNASSLAVGVGGSDNSLSILDGGVVSNFNGFVGNEPGASNNTVLVSGTGSRWDNGGDLFLGNLGVSNNSITVENEGTISAFSLTVYTSNNFNLNTDGHLEIGGIFDAGQSGFNWNDGGSLSVGGQFFGLPVTNLNNNDTTLFEGTDKKLTLTGSGAIWHHGGNDLVIGLEGSDNQLIVTNGAQVLNSDAYVGYAANADNNTVVITGTNSLWNNAGTLTVGSSNNTGNAVSISNGGEISASNLVVHSGGTVNLNEGGILSMLGDFNASDPLAQFSWNGGGTFSVGGDLSGLDGLHGTNQLLTIDGGTWLQTNDLAVGLDGFGNNLTVQNGGVVSNDNAFVGQNAGADSNTVTVTGANSLWASTGTLEVGSAATNSRNEVTVENGGTVAVAGLTVYTNNNFNLNSGGTFDVAGTFNAGQDGFNWNDGGALVARSNLNGIVTIAGTGKSLTLDGGSMTNSLKTLNVGWTQSGNEVEVLNGGRIEMDQVRIGYGAGADQNKLKVSGTNSSVFVADTLMVGREGSGNRLEIGSMGRVTNQTAYVGYDPYSANNNSVTVSGDGAKWINGSLNIGAYTNSIPEGGGTPELTVNSGNDVSVSDGGFVQADTLVIQDGNSFSLGNSGTLRMTGDFDHSATEVEGLAWLKGGNLSIGGALSGITNLNAGRVLTLDGAGAIWDLVQTDIAVGGDGIEGSTLVSTNGAIISAANLNIEGSGNSVNVEDAWLLVGDGATTNTLAGGGVMVSSTNGALLSVDDSAALMVSQTLQIGASSTDTGTVSVANGGTITAGDLSIFDANSAFNLNDDGTLRVTGDFDNSTPGFNWNEGGHLSVGGELQNLSGLLQTNHQLTIGGSNAVWNLGASDLVVGSTGSGNELRIEDGGLVVNAAAFVGSSVEASNNTVTVTGEGSLWNNSGLLTIGSAGFNISSVTNDLGGGSNEVVSVTNHFTSIGNTVAVESGGTVIANDLTIYTNNSFNLNNDGTLRITGDFDVSEYINTNFTTLNWESGGTLQVDGDLALRRTELVVEGSTNTYAFMDGGHIISVGGSLSHGGATNLIVGLNSSNNELIITNGASVDNANGFIGWGSDAANNSVLVSGSGSTWTNRENLYVGSYGSSSNLMNAGTGNSLIVEDNAWVFAGDVTTNDLGAGATNGGIAVASSTGSELVVGNGDVEVDTLYVGAGSSFTGTVDVLSKGSITLHDLVIANGTGAFNLEGSLTVVSNSFNATQNGFDWQDGGDLVMSDSDLFGLSALSGSNKTVTLNGGSWSNATALSIDGYKNKLSVSANSLVTSDGGFIGSTTNDFENSVVVSGSNSVWQNSGDLYVGKGASDNSLTISDGGYVTNMNAYIGDAATATNNAVTVRGSNSVWDVNGDLYVGKDGSDNSLTVEESGSVLVGQDLHVRNNSTLELDGTNSTVSVARNMYISDSTVTNSGSVVFNGDPNTLYISGTGTVIGADVVFDGGGGTDSINVSNWTFKVTGNETNQYAGFENLNITNGTLAGSGTLDAFDTTVSGGWIAPDGDLVIEGNFAVADNVTLQVAAGVDSLRVTDTNGLDIGSISAEVTVRDSANPTTINDVFLTADGGFNGPSFASTNFIEHFLLYDFLLTNDATTVSVVSDAALNGEIGAGTTYAAIQGVRSGFNGMQNAVFTRTRQLRRNLVATAHAIPNEAFLLGTTNSPSGAMGPGDNNTIFGMNFWAEQYSGKGDYDRQGNVADFEQFNNGSSMGLDRLFGEALVAGINYTYARSVSSASSGDHVETETYWLGLYGEYVNEQGLYVDALVALARSNYDTERRDVNYRGDASFRGYDIGGHIDIGNYFHHENWAMAPYVGLHYLAIKADSYTETEVSGTEVRVDETDVDSLESVIGFKLRNRIDTGIGRFQTVGYVEWMYDFLNEDIGNTLSDGTVSVKTSRITPDETLINTGIGLGWTCTDYMEIGAGYDARFNDHYEEHTGTLMLNIMF